MRDYLPDLLGGFLATIGRCLATIGLLLVIGGGCLILVVGPWDLLVWALKADWHTTHGLASLAGVGLVYVGVHLERVGNDWVMEESAARTRRALANYEVPPTPIYEKGLGARIAEQLRSVEGNTHETGPHVAGRGSEFSARPSLGVDQEQ